MAKDSLPQCHSAFNSDNQFSSCLLKAQALITVALNNGLENCSKSVQHEYLSILDDFIGHAVEVSDREVS